MLHSMYRSGGSSVRPRNWYNAASPCAMHVSQASSPTSYHAEQFISHCVSRSTLIKTLLLRAAAAAGLSPEVKKQTFNKNAGTDGAWHRTTVFSVGAILRTLVAKGRRVSRLSGQKSPVGGSTIISIITNHATQRRSRPKKTQQ